MSLEQAIIEHASAIRELAAALLQRAAPLNALAAEAGKAIKELKAGALGPDASDTQDDGSELEEAVQKVETKGKADSEAARKAAAKAATDQANADAKAAREKQAAEKAAAAEAKPLDYMKEVAPVLNKAVQKDRQGVIDLLASFGAKKGADVPAAKHAELLAGAQAILAA